MRTKIFALSLMLVLCGSLYPQSLSQLGFIIKKAVPDIEVIAVIFGEPAIGGNKTRQMESEARPATLITKKKFVLLPCQTRSEIAQKLYEAQKLKKVAFIAITDDDIITPSIVQFIAQRAGESGFPVISNREKDTLQGALLSIFMQDGKIQKHINKIISAALELTIPEEFLAECKIDAE